MQGIGRLSALLLLASGALADTRLPDQTQSFTNETPGVGHLSSFEEMLQMSPVWLASLNKTPRWSFGKTANARPIVTLGGRDWE